MNTDQCRTARELRSLNFPHLCPSDFYLWRQFWIWLLVVGAYVASNALAAAKDSTRPADSSGNDAAGNPRNLVAIMDLRDVLDDDGASVAQKIEACDQLAEWGPRAWSAAPALAKQLRRRGTLGRHAMRALLANDPDEVVKALVDQLTSNDPLSRAVATGALANMGDHAEVVIARMIDLLGLKDPKASQIACSVLEGMGPAASRAVPLLLEELHGVNESACNAAIAALQAIEPKASPRLFPDIRGLYPFYPTPTWRVRDLAAMGAGASLALTDLVALCDSPDSDLRDAVELALSHLDRPDPECIPGLIQLAKGKGLIGRAPSKMVSRRAVAYLGLTDAGSKGVLLELIHDPDVGDAAATALGNIRDADGEIAQILGDLLEERLVVRRRAAVALGGGGAQPRRVLVKLIEALSDDDLEIRRAVAAAIARVGPEAVAAVPPLTANLRRGDESSKTAAQALGAIGAASRSSAPELIAAIRAAPRNPFAAEVRTDSDRLRWACAAALVRVDPGSKETADLLVEAVRKRDWIVREVLAPALGNTPARESVTLNLKTLTSDPNELVRVNARCALRELSETATTQPVNGP